MFALPLTFGGLGASSLATSAMKKLLFSLSGTFLLLTGCDAYRERQLRGTFKLVKSDQMNMVRQVELTPSKCIFTVAGTELPSDYKVEGDYLYTQIENYGVRLRIVSPDTLRGEVVFYGLSTFVRQN